MIKINGIEISNVAVSTIFGHGGDGMFPLIFSPQYREILDLVKKQGNTIFTKSTTSDKHIGNYIAHKPWTWGCIRNLGSEGMINAYGLTNAGALKNAQKVIKAKSKGFNVVPNIFLEYSRLLSEKDIIDRCFLAIVKFLSPLHETKIVKINISCPNSGEEVKDNTAIAVKAIERLKLFLPKLTFIAKVGYDHPVDFIKQLEDAGIDIIQAINTIPFARLFPHHPSPLAHFGGGGVSGKPAQEAALKKCEEFRKATELPMIMSCGIIDVESGQRMFDIGADSISICTVIRQNPQNAKKILTHKGWRK